MSIKNMAKHFAISFLLFGVAVFASTLIIILVENTFEIKLPDGFKLGIWAIFAIFLL